MVIGKLFKDELITLALLLTGKTMKCVLS